MDGYENWIEMQQIWGAILSAEVAMSDAIKARDRAAFDDIMQRLSVLTGDYSRGRTVIARQAASLRGVRPVTDQSYLRPVVVLPPKPEPIQPSTLDNRLSAKVSATPVAVEEPSAKPEAEESIPLPVRTGTEKHVCETCAHWLHATCRHPTERHANQKTGPGESCNGWLSKRDSCKYLLARTCRFKLKCGLCVSFQPKPSLSVVGWFTRVDAADVEDRDPSPSELLETKISPDRRTWANPTPRGKHAICPGCGKNMMLVAAGDGWKWRQHVKRPGVPCEESGKAPRSDAAGALK